MNFDLSDEQYAMQRELLRVLEDLYPLDRLRAIADAPASFDAAAWRQLAGLGYAAVGIPESHGGMGLGMLDAALVAEAFGYSAAPGHLIAHAMAVEAISRGASAAQRAFLLPRLASGAKSVTVALAEEGDVWQPEQWRLDADAGRLTGAKRNVLIATDADYFLVGLAGGSLALVETGAPGLTVEPVDGIDRTRPIGWLHFDATPFEPLPDGARAAPRMRDAGLVLIAADAFGGASRAVELSVDYVGERVQFDKPVGAFQAIKHRIADMGTRVETSRGLYWYAAYAFDGEPAQSARVAALSKALLADWYELACRDLVELHGGVGFTWEHHAQIWYKRAVFDRYYLGQPSVHRRRAASLAGW